MSEQNLFQKSYSPYRCNLREMIVLGGNIPEDLGIESVAEQRSVGYYMKTLYRVTCSEEVSSQRH